MLHLVDNAQISVHIHILDAPNEITQRLITPASAVADGRITTPKRNLNHDDV
jgi:hypothetical protein